MKVLDSNNFSQEEVKAFSNLYERLLKRYKFKGQIRDAFSIASLIEAIEKLPPQNKQAIYAYLNNKEPKKEHLYSALSMLRTINYRAVYETQIANYITRATDYKDYEPCIVFGFVKLYDTFSGCSCNKKISKKFSIYDIDNIIWNMPTNVSDVLILQFGLLTGRPLYLKEVAKELNISISNCNKLSQIGLYLLRECC